MEVKTLGVVGAGQMGAGIAQVAAQAGLDVVCSDVSDAALARVTFTTDLKTHARCDFVVEAVTESEDLKRRIFKELDGVCRAEAVLASNTSSISITRLAAATSRPERFIGMHFMNPVPIMQLVEVIRGIATADETYALTKALAERMGKTTTVSKDFPGFLANRILMPMINEAFYALYEGVGSAEDIDTTMKLGTNQPMGPLTLADFIGLDTCLAIMNVLHEGLGDPKYRACPLLRRMVAAGHLGRKSGQGFYKY